jgi:hypothetical protein
MEIDAEISAQAPAQEERRESTIAAMPKKPMHPLAEAALRTGAKVGEKAVKRVMREGIRAGLDSVLEDVEGAAGEVTSRAKGAREKLRGGVGQVREENMPEETEEEALEEEEEEEEDEDEAEEDDGDWETIGAFQDAEHFVREAYSILDELAEKGKFSRTAVDQLAKIHDKIADKLPED